MVENGNLLSVRSDKKVDVIPVANLAVLVLGPGTSISGDAARLCAKHDCYVSFARGGFNIHSVWHTGRYQDPQPLLRQALLFSDPIKKLEVAKKLTKIRVKKEGGAQKELERIESFSELSNLLSFEGLWAKQKYKDLACEFSTKFKRDQNSIEGVNGKLSLLNNLLYSYVTTIILSMGLSPSMGFVHGSTRRGGLTFDVADIFKMELVMIPAFMHPGISNQAAMHNLSRKLKSKRSRISKEIISIISDII